MWFISIIIKLREKLKSTEHNYRRICDDFEKSQRLLTMSATRELNLQHSLSILQFTDDTNTFKLQFLHQLDSLKRHVAMLEAKYDELVRENRQLMQHLQGYREFNQRRRVLNMKSRHTK
ncbi:uncharacterized protein LOC135160617 [Diachasmimorpha longicaudata]|uniref:uncharacterized protein LOC135160617 n=1 Tax=Diachasmimorpha longicaudata TaxID=58733 RepID=UPI0030B8742B